MISPMEVVGSTDEILSLPMFPEMGAAQVDYVSDALLEFFAGRQRGSPARVKTALTTA